MPGIGGVEATAQMAMIAPLTRVLVLTISDQDADVMEAIVAGACGYLLKEASIGELITGIRAAANGESLDLAGDRRRRCCSASARRPPQRRRRDRPLELSDREMQVLKLIANGKTTRRSPPSSTSARRRSRTTSRTS